MLPLWPAILAVTLMVIGSAIMLWLVLCGGDGIDSIYDDPDAGEEDPKGPDLDSGEEDDWAWTL